MFYTHQRKSLKVYKTTFSLAELATGKTLRVLVGPNLDDSTSFFRAFDSPFP